MSAQAAIYFITGLVAIFTGLIFFNISRLSAEAKLREERERKRREELLVNHPPADKPLQEAVVEELKTVIDSPDRSQAISNKLLYVFDKELAKRVEKANLELNKKYESVINEKIQEQEVAWKKYNTVLSEKKETDAVIRSIAEGLVVVDALGKVVMMNPAAERLLGVSRKEKLGKPISEGLKEEQLVSLSHSGADKSKEIELSSGEDETKKILRASSAVIENETGQTVGMVSVLSDITKQKELDRMKSHFVASVSHELRTPLVAIDKSISLILTKAAGPLTDNQEQFLTIAERNLKRLSRLIDDLLDLSKIEAGKMQVTRQASQIEKTINEVVFSLDNWAKAKSITLSGAVEPGLPEANFDHDRITQVLINLIGNAIKFTPQRGTIKVGARLRSQDKALEVSIMDTGIGISKENLPKVFDKFFQGGERVSTDINGTGIGLALSKEIVQLHGGKIWVESEKGKGTTFIFTLPLQ